MNQGRMHPPYIDLLLGEMTLDVERDVPFRTL